MDILRMFKDAGWSGTVYPDSNSADKAMQAENQYKPIPCPYMKEDRTIHPDVCRWHRETKDPRCLEQGCQYADWREAETIAEQQQTFLKKG